MELQLGLQPLLHPPQIPSVLLLKGSLVWPVLVLKQISLSTYKIQRYNIATIQFVNAHDLYEWSEQYEEKIKHFKNRKLQLAIKKARKEKQKLQISRRGIIQKIQIKTENQKFQENLSCKFQQSFQSVYQNIRVEEKKLNFIDALHQINLNTLIDDLKKSQLTKVTFFDTYTNQQKQIQYKPKLLLITKLQIYIQDLTHLFILQGNVKSEYCAIVRKIMNSDLITPLDYIYSRVLRNIKEFQKQLQIKSKGKIPQKVVSYNKFLVEQKNIIKDALKNHLHNYSVFLEVQKDLLEFKNLLNFQNITKNR